MTNFAPANKTKDRAASLAKSVVGRQADRRIVTHMLFAAITANPVTFGNLFKLTAAKFKAANPAVDDRMKAGKEMLLAVAETNECSTFENSYVLDLPDLPEYVGNPADHECITTNLTALLDVAETNENDLDIAAEAFYAAMRTTHSTTTQSFLGSLRAALLAIDSNKLCNNQGNAFQDRMPMV